MTRKPVKDRQRASVTLQPGGKPGRCRRWAYDYQDLARLLGLTYASMRQKVFKGWEPTLSAICAEWYRKRKPACPGCMVGLVPVRWCGCRDGGTCASCVPGENHSAKRE